MKFEPIKCDSCGNLIKNLDEGWVEWLTNEDKNAPHGWRDHGIRIVHHNSLATHYGIQWNCQYNTHLEFAESKSIVCDLSLTELIGNDGLMQLLKFLHLGRFDKDEVLEIIKRLHIPGYDKARAYFTSAISQGVFEPNTPDGYYRTRDIESVLRFIEQDEA